MNPRIVRKILLYAAALINVALIMILLTNNKDAKAKEPNIAPTVSEEYVVCDVNGVIIVSDLHKHLDTYRNDEFTVMRTDTCIYITEKSTNNTSVLYSGAIYTRSLWTQIYKR